MRSALKTLAAMVPTAKADVDVRPPGARALPNAGLFTATTNEVGLRAARRSGTTYALLNRLAADTARPTWHLALDDPEGGEPRRRYRHPALSVWARPNPTMTPTRRSLIYLGQQWLDILGECFLQVVTTGRRGQGLPVELWPISPLQMHPVADGDRFIAGWVHTAVDGTRTPLTVDQVIQLKYPDPDNPLRGLPPLLSVLSEIDASEAASDYQRMFFHNSAIPGGFVTSDADMTATEFDEWVERWDEQHQGVHNAWRIHLMDRGGKFIPQTTSLKDMLLTELIESHRDSIREAFGVSRTMLGMAESETNRATAEAAEYVYGKYTLRDRLDVWAEAGNQLTARYPSARATGQSGPWEMRHQLDVIPANVDADVKDRDSRVRAAVEMMKQGADPAQALDAFGLPPIDFDGSAQVQAAARMLQQLYLATPDKTVVTTDEARDLVRRLLPDWLQGPGPRPPAPSTADRIDLDQVDAEIAAVLTARPQLALNGHHP